MGLAREFAVIRHRFLPLTAERPNSPIIPPRGRLNWLKWLFPCGLAVGLGGGIFLSATPSSPLLAESTTDDESPRTRVLEWLIQMHSTDQIVARRAVSELQSLGLTDQQLRDVGRLKHPDPRQRLELAQELAAIDETLRSALQSELENDPDRRVVETARAMARRPQSSNRSQTSAIATGRASSESASNRLNAIDDEHDFEVLSQDGVGSGRLVSVVVNANNRPSFANSTESSSPSNEGIRPNILRRPPDEDALPYVAAMEAEPWIEPKYDAPFGFAGPSGILPFENQENSHFVPQPDRWRNGYEPSDRYGKGHPWVDDYHGVEGHWWDPYNQNVLKGDYPVYGQHTFFEVTAQSVTRYEHRQVPTPTSPFESTVDPDQVEFFGDPNQDFVNQNFSARFALFHANDAAFKPIDWQVVATPVVNINHIDVRELAIVNPDVRRGTNRTRNDVALQEYFVEAKLADISPNYDFISVRAGSQPFNSDFRGFIFSDCNRGVRLFGTNFSNRHQFNVAYFDMQEKETNSQLNTFDDRHQDVVVANYYIQDFIFPGYTAQASFHFNNDQPSFLFDRNNFLVRPDPAGVYQPHRVEAYYFGLAGDGHIGRVNVSNAFYWVTGRDGLNPIAGDQIDISAFMAALELSYDRDWARFRASFFYASGDDNPYDRNGEGFDSILDNQNFAGGEFSYWNHQQIGLFGVNLTQRNSLLPDLRSSKLQGQSNFTNPGLMLFNLGFDADITPKLKMINNVNYLLFNEVAVLQEFVFQRRISRKIGLDLSSGFEWRPFHNDNMILSFGASALVPDQGFKDLYSEYAPMDADVLYGSFFEAAFTF